VLRVDPQGKIGVKGCKWKISKALCGEWVQLVAAVRRPGGTRRIGASGAEAHLTTSTLRGR
jgi:hypothetical protein